MAWNLLVDGSGAVAGAGAGHQALSSELLVRGPRPLSREWPGHQ